MSLLTALSLMGCAAQIRADAIKNGKDHCESEGKQWILKSVEEKSGPTLVGPVIVVSGECVGPDDPGYIPSGKAN
jgi:hypothetical protein